jgi:hypothetical protein
LVSSGITAYDLNKIKNYINDLDEFISETISLIQEGYNPIKVIKEYDQFINAGMSYREANDWVARGFSFNEAHSVEKCRILSSTKQLNGETLDFLLTKQKHLETLVYRKG